MLRFLTAGESHGRALVVILEGLPAGLPIVAGDINRELARRQQGYGRGPRMRIEADRAQILSGVRLGQTLGTPLALLIENRDWPNWRDSMQPEPLRPGAKIQTLTRPRPGHADLAGALKYDRRDLRDILERASARETTARVAAGAVAKILLSEFGVRFGSWVDSIGPVRSAGPGGKPSAWANRAETSDVRCPDPKTAAAMRRAIDRAGRAGDTLGGVFTVSSWGLPAGLGSHVHWDRRLDTALAGALMSIPAVKGVEIGLGFAAAGLPGSRVHDPITFRAGRGYGRRSNQAGGLEGGITTGEPLLLRAAMKPIATLRKPLPSVDMKSHRPLAAGYERSDVCAVPAAAVVGEAMVALVLARAWQEKFGGDSLADLRAAWKAYLSRLARA